MTLVINKLWTEKLNCVIKNSFCRIDNIQIDNSSFNQLEKYISSKTVHDIYINNELASCIFFCDNVLISSGLFSFQFNIFDLFHNKNEFEFSEFGSFYETFLSHKRRKRRKFANEEERRIARILKNRKTAEESRQRRIRKMKILESFTMISQEREKRLRKEMYLLSKNLMDLVSKND